MAYKHTDLGAIQIWECSRGQQPSQPRCSVKEGDVRCEQPGRHRCAHPIRPRQRQDVSVPGSESKVWRTQRTCERLLCDEHKAKRDGIVVCPFHGGSQ